MQSFCLDLKQVKSSVLFLCRVYAPTFLVYYSSKFELPTWLEFLINQFANVYVNYTLIVAHPQVSSQLELGDRRREISFFLHKIVLVT